MPVYAWEGKTLGGIPRKGLVRADSEGALRAQLRKEQIVLLKARAEKRAAKDSPNPKKKIKPQQVMLFTRQLSTMIASGLPLVQSLGVLASQVEDRGLKAIVSDIKERIEGGSRFADALKEYPKCFDSLYVNLVVAGEEGGTLDTVLSRLAVYMEKIQKLKKRVKSALIYPVSIVFVAIGVIMVLLIFVIPVFDTMFRDMGATLPGPTQFVISLSRAVKSTVHYLIGLLVVLAFLFRRYYQTEAGRMQIDKSLLKIPVFGVLILKASIARVTRTLATLLSSGVAILESLLIVARIAGNKVIENAFIVARMRISEGKSMSEPLADSRVFPPMVIQMVQVGESTGSLDAMLNKIADFYEDDVDNMITNMTALMEPAIMVFLGVVLGGLLIAMYMPIFKLGSVVG
jgi:type IV pilus assembly protein PilC